MTDQPPLTIRGHGLTADFLPLGATLLRLRLDGHDAPLQLGLDDPRHYPEHAEYMGATVGRVANRIGDARFELDGKIRALDANDGPNMLHGGSEGLSHRIWTVVEHGPTDLVLRIDDADGEMGFPGAVRVTARMSLHPGACLRIDYEARADAPTPCNIAHHSYWCLDDTGDLSSHVLTVAADRYTPVDDALIPTGQVAPVGGTVFDFRAGRSLPGQGVLDHNLCLSDGPVALRDVAELRSTASGVSMRIATTEPGLQVYDGAKLDVAVAGLDGRRYGPHAGTALEPQGWPDAPNHERFPSVILRPGETYRQSTTFTFSKGTPR